MSQWFLGECYQQGDGVQQDYVEAVKWFRIAAEQGYGDAIISLGNCYQNGLGVPKNQEEADKWFRKVSKQKR